MIVALLTDSTTLGTISAGLMILGYALYVLFLFRHRTRANATAWGLMCISASVLLTIEYLYGVPWNGLKAGAADAIAAFLVMGIAYALGRMLYWSAHDKKLVAWHILLLGVYLAADVLNRTDAIESQAMVLVGIVVILASTATSVIEFIPLLRETWQRNEDELPWAWMVWTASYVVYLYVRIIEGVAGINLVYPIVCIALHGAVALLTVPFVWSFLRNRLHRPYRPL